MERNSECVLFVIVMSQEVKLYEDSNVHSGYITLTWVENERKDAEEKEL